METSNLLKLTVLSCIIYFILYMLLDDVFLYIIGGFFGVILNFLVGQANSNVLILLWSILLVVAVLLYYKSSKRVFKYSILCLTVLLLYLIDFILYDILTFDSTDIKIRYFNISIMIILKGILLASIIYFKNKREHEKTIVL